MRRPVFPVHKVTVYNNGKRGTLGDTKKMRRPVFPESKINVCNDRQTGTIGDNIT